jgi:hypothetical protein
MLQSSQKQRLYPKNGRIGIDFHFEIWHTAAFESLFTEEIVMPGLGEYVADATEGITNPDDLPKPKIQQRSRTPKKYPCPDCQRPATRHEIREPITPTSSLLLPSVLWSRMACLIGW